MLKIINFTPTGTQPTRENSYAPLLPNEIIDTVHEANEIGISMVHLHARDEDTLKNTYKKEVYQIRYPAKDIKVSVKNFQSTTFS